MAKGRFGLAFTIAGSTTVLCWLLFALFFHNQLSLFLFVLGNLTIGAGVLIILLAINTLRRSGQPETGQAFTETIILVKEGIYSVVRHPLYLGWLLTYPAAMLLSQHWLVIALGGAGIASLIAICEMADRELTGKFGTAYEQYMREVPRLNLLLGVARKVRSKMQGRKEQDDDQRTGLY